MLLPPSTKLGPGNIFSSVCQEFYPQGGGAVPWEVPPGRYNPSVRYTLWASTPRQVQPPWAGTPQQVNPPGQVHPWQVHPAGNPPGQVHPPGQVPPWSMSGPYASYWNAFLFYKFDRNFKAEKIRGIFFRDFPGI